MELKFVIPNMEKTFGNLEFAGEDKVVQRRINGRLTVLSRSYKESQQAKQERPAVKSDFSSPKVERQGNTVQEKTVQKPATSTTTADRTSQRPITKERPSTVQRVPLQNTRSRPPIKTATIKKVGKKP